MTDKHINKTIAEACEWKGHLFCTDMAGNPFPGWDEPPDCCNDLNKMHEAEQWLVKADHVSFDEYIRDLMNLRQSGVTATARQRAEAFLKTIGKWEE